MSLLFGERAMPSVGVGESGMRQAQVGIGEGSLRVPNDMDVAGPRATSAPSLPAGSALDLLAGSVLLLVGGWAGLRGNSDLGAQRTPFPRPKDESQLITTGLYARVRQPLYLSVIALGFAWALLWRSAPALGLALLQVPFFDLKARREERWLRERHAGYDDYARRV